MRKFFLASIALIAFSAATIIFQMSCQKTVDAQTSSYTLPPATTTTLGGIIVGNGLSITGNGTLSVAAATSGLTQLNKLLFTKEVDNPYNYEIWTVNYDGTNATKVNITLPSGVDFVSEAEMFMSPDGKKIFFMTEEEGRNYDKPDVYSCNADGTNLTKIIDGGESWVSLEGAY